MAYCQPTVRQRARPSKAAPRATATIVTETLRHQFGFLRWFDFIEGFLAGLFEGAGAFSRFQYAGFFTRVGLVLYFGYFVFSIGLFQSASKCFAEFDFFVGRAERAGCTPSRHD